MIIIPLKKIEIPPLGFHLIVETLINGTATNLVIDTGASRSVIDLEYLNSIMDSLSLEEESIQSAGVGGSNLKSYTTVLDFFGVGELKITDYEVAVMDLSHVKASYEQIGEKPIYGVIGGDLLLEHKAIIDYATLELKFRIVKG